jgi:hypothetical protein
MFSSVQLVSERSIEACGVAMKQLKQKTKTKTRA